jgi:argininosuccinate lyase
MEGFDLTISSLQIMAPLVAGLTVDAAALRRGFAPEVFATDRALELVAKGMPFRDAYNEVKNNLQQLAGHSPDAALAAKQHYGAPAGLDFAATARRIKDAASWATRETKRLQACRDRLFTKNTKK